MIRKSNYNNNANKKGVIINYKTWAANIILGRKRKKSIEDLSSLHCEYDFITRKSLPRWF
jgi:hypothetical protein